MRITIRDRFKPFTHTEGSLTLLPESFLAFQIFPTEYHVYSLLAPLKKLIKIEKLPLTGPFKSFTVILDLEKICIEVFGESQEGFFNYFLYPTTNKEEYSFIVKRFPVEISSVSYDILEKTQLPRLSLGVNKKLEIENVWQRADVNEIFPLLYRIGSLCPALVEETKPIEGMINYFEKKDYKTFFHNAFLGLFFPLLEDTKRQGLFKAPYTPTIPALVLLKKSATSIQAMYLDLEADTLALLQEAPKESIAGRFLGFERNGLHVDFEWSKRAPRRLIITSSQERELTIVCPQEIRSCRVQTASKKMVIKAPFKIACKAHEALYLDNFKK
jgi:hypothetical protein